MFLIFKKTLLKNSIKYKKKYKNEINHFLSWLKSF